MLQEEDYLWFPEWMVSISFCKPISLACLVLGLCGMAWEAWDGLQISYLEIRFFTDKARDDPRELVTLELLDHCMHPQIP